MASVDDFSLSLLSESTELIAVPCVVAVFEMPVRGDVVVVGVVVAVSFDANEVDAMSAGATAVGGVKNVPSSKVSRKSLAK